MPRGLGDDCRERLVLKRRPASALASGPRAAAADPASIEGAWRLHPGGDDQFGFLKVAVARAAVPAALHVRIWKHTGSWVHNVSVDYVEVRRSHSLPLCVGRRAPLSFPR